MAINCSIITKHHLQYFTATILEWKHLLKPDKYKDVIIDSLKFMVKKNWVEVNVFAIMSNHIHLIWQMQEGYEREAIQRNFLKFVSQTIKRDLEKNHPKVLERFYVGAKDRAYHPDNCREGTQSFKHRFMDEGSIYSKDGIHSLKSCSRGIMRLSGRVPIFFGKVI